MAPLPAPKRTEVLPGIWLDTRRGVFFERQNTLVVADLHWGYAASHRTRGNLLPLWGDDEIEARLLGLLADYRPGEMIWLGDSLHTLAGADRAQRFLERSPVPVTVLRGNHDLRWTAISHDQVERDGFVFHHGDRLQPWPEGLVEVIGHHHPAFSWSDGAGTRLKLPALVTGPRRLILPAFSPWAGGVPWNGNLALDEKMWVIAPRRIFPVPPFLPSP